MYVKLKWVSVEWYLLTKKIIKTN